MYGIFDHTGITVHDVLFLVGCFVLSRFAWEGIKKLWGRIVSGPKESCTQCHFELRCNVPEVTNLMMLTHYENSHPKLATAARIKYGKKEES